MSVVPGRGIFWCRRECGKRPFGEICKDLIYNDGYCLEPKLRQAYLVNGDVAERMRRILSGVEET